MKNVRATSRQRLRQLGWFIVMALLLGYQEVRADWLQDFEAATVERIKTAKIPGVSIAIVENNAVIYAKGFGHLYEDPASPPVDADTVFDIGSLSKAFTATQLAMLVDAQILKWTDPVKEQLALFKMRDPWVNRQFQVEDLLCHRSGLPWYSQFAMVFLGYSPEAQVRAIRFKEAATSFRTSFAYQNNMYITASKLIEAKSGLSWQQHLADNLFKPLGMTRSVASESAKWQLPNVAPGHMLLADGQLWPIPRDWVNSFFVDNVMGAGAIRSSARDMAQWLLFNLNQGKWNGAPLVSESNMRYLQAPRVLQAPSAQMPFIADPSHPGPVSYGAGWQYFSVAPQPFITHDGTEPGYKTNVLLMPGAQVGIVILSNIGANFTDNTGLNDRPAAIQKISFDFYDRYFGLKVTEQGLTEQVTTFQTYQGQPIQSSATVAVTPQRPLKIYEGIYRHPAYGQFKVRKSGDTLNITMGPRAIRAGLTPVGPNAFKAYLPGYPLGSQFHIPFNFAFPAQGPVTMTIPAVAGWPQNEVFQRVAQ